MGLTATWWTVAFLNSTSSALFCWISSWTSLPPSLIVVDQIQTLLLGLGAWSHQAEPMHSSPMLPVLSCWHTPSKTCNDGCTWSSYLTPSFPCCPSHHVCARYHKDPWKLEKDSQVQISPHIDLTWVFNSATACQTVDSPSSSALRFCPIFALSTQVLAPMLLCRYAMNSLSSVQTPDATAACNPVHCSKAMQLLVILCQPMGTSWIFVCHADLSISGWEISSRSNGIMYYSNSLQDGSWPSMLLETL